MEAKTALRGSLLRAISHRPAPDDAEAGQAVLLVDDEDVAREAVAERLCELGYRVSEAVEDRVRCTCWTR